MVKNWREEKNWIQDFRTFDNRLQATMMLDSAYLAIQPVKSDPARLKYCTRALCLVPMRLFDKYKVVLAFLCCTMIPNERQLDLYSEEA